MNIPTYLDAHWVELLTSAIVGVLVWIATNVIGGPLIAFWSDRRNVFEAVQQHGAVGWLASEERIKTAQAALSAAAAKMIAYAQGGPLIVRLYCWLRRYDLSMAGRALNGLHDIAGGAVADDLRINNCDAVRLCLRARGLSTRRSNEVRRMIREACSQA
jgi:hypothetical protein